MCIYHRSLVVPDSLVLPSVVRCMRFLHVLSPHNLTKACHLMLGRHKQRPSTLRHLSWALSLYDPYDTVLPLSHLVNETFAKQEAGGRLQANTAGTLLRHLTAAPSRSFTTRLCESRPP